MTMTFRVVAVAAISALLAGLHPASANAASAVCENAWELLPDLLPDPSYESPNDSDLVYRDFVVRLRNPYSIWANELKNATQNFVQVRGILATWTNQLAAAERSFWTDFDTDGEVTQDSINELAYWLHKREVWSIMRYNMVSSVNTQAAGALRVLFGDGEFSFLPPSEFPPGATPDPEADIGKSFSTPSFRGYIAQLVQLSFLRLSACAPGQSGTASGRVLQNILNPYYNVSYASTFWKSVQDWAAAGPGRMEQLDKILSDLTPKQKLDTGAMNIINEVMLGKTTSATDIQYERYSQLMQRLRVMSFVYLSTPQFSANGFSVMYTDQNSMPRSAVVINGAALELVNICVNDNWETIRRYYFDQTSTVGMQYVLNPSMESIQYEKHLGYVALIACGSADGLDDPRVVEMIAPYANPRRQEPAAEPVRRSRAMPQ